MIGLDEPHRIDTSENGKFYLLSGRGGAQIKLSASAFHLLQAVHNGVSFEDLAERLKQGGRSKVSAAELSAAYERVTAEIASIESRQADQPFPGSGFWGRLPLIPSSLVARIASGLMVTFNPGVVAALLALTATGGVMIYFQRIPLRLEADSWIPTYMLLLVSLLLHELGHATACARFGAKPGYGVSFSLNPIFKFDGYWVLADALGVTNLSRQPSRLLSHALARFRGLPVKPLPWRSPTTVLLSVYCIASFGVWAVFMFRLRHSCVAAWCRDSSPSGVMEPIRMRESPVFSQQA